MAEESASSMPSPQALVAEFVGTFMLIFTVGCNVLSGNAVWGGVSIACVLMVMIYALGGISGANFNPAVSFALGLSKALGGDGLPWASVGCYMAVQMTAGCVAKSAYRALYGDYFVLGAAEGYGYLNAGVVEMLYTMVLCFVVLNVAIAKNVQGNQYYGLAIGFVITAGAYGAGGVSGGCFNPAVAFGVTSLSPWTALYTMFELAGAALAVGLFTVVRPADFGKAENPTVSKLTAEFIGTYVLVLTVGLNVLGRSPAAAFSIAASLMCMIYALGDVSGAHFNPAVTCALVAIQAIKPAEAAQYIGSQIAGGMAAGFTYCGIMQGRSFPLGAKNGSSWTQVAIAEIIFTFLLCYVVMGAAVSEKTKTKQMFGLVIGSCVTVGGFAIGGISGGSLNPAVSIGIATPSFTFHVALIYSAFEIIGAFLAAGIYKITHEPDAVAEEKELNA